ncbi:BTAD domain-containing putative transcriptional regulator [Streptomyces sp. NPDC051909]|uniref:ATP-binding protein n=1 Tax=Streptomyces sp. NPDC051909 TaxID=3154944 RepID=UPI0034267548
MIFRLLGPLTVGDPPVPAAVGGPRVRALLALLLLDAGRIVPTGRLVDGLYGDEPPAGAANALQSQVSRLRRAGLPEGVTVEHSAAGYRLAGVGGEDVDALRFERLAREGARAGAAGDAVRAEELLREALGLWRGPALADVREAPYAEGQAARLDALRLDALEEWAAARLATGGDPAPLVRALAQAATAHPLRERLRALQIRALAGAGRQAEALAAYEEVRGALAEALGADPSAELAAAHLAVLRGEATSRPAAAARPPVPLTDLVGRERERERLGVLLAAARLVTLVGPGGAGKTRLALELVQREQQRERQRVEPGAFEAVFVDLSAVGPGEVAGACARALGVRDGGADALLRALAGRAVLLVVDNCEHVVAEAARLVRVLLAGSGGLRVLATSREALGITGESLLPLGALAARAAEELFLRRGAAARPGFAEAVAGPDADPDARARVREVCAALDGLPLALELAAARLRTLTLGELADRLGDRLGDRRGDRRGDRFRVLSRGDRTAPERHRTLAAVVDWSWELLDEEERTAAARFSVFRGGATAEAAAAVWGTDLADAEDLLASLTEKSLMEAGSDGSTGSRFRMLETVRAYAAGRLPADDPAHAAHTAHFLALARAADPELRGPDQLDRLARLDAEDPNLRAALRRATPADGLRLVAALTGYWWLRGLRGQVAGLVAELLERVDAADLVDRGAGEVLDGLGEEYALCVLTAGARDPERPERLARARRLLRERAEPLRQPFTAFLWATAVGPEDRLPVPADAWSRALGLAGQGHLALAHGDRDTAEQALTAALDAFRALGDRWGTATALEGLAGLSPEPLPLLAEALDLFESLGVAEDIVDLLGRRAALHEAAGVPEAALADRARAAGTARRAGLPDPG